ncbi:PHA-granule associated protein 4 [Cupriavidus sp. AU9028]|uniref:PHA-granule associated protein 4 n=1 Tax=Cupriavidus sp. AU9028 TaxID=2871157 RepID=UPI001C96B878|nr:PHA-granule associated protein 4 [Cupriavidus sp. AU9028]MBY4896939.1 PHA-granule associated protein 4 [Cupriavidus sp. AU9028]
MSNARAASRTEALRLLAGTKPLTLQLDYESGWQDAVELGRLGEKRGIRVQYRGQESIAVRCPQALAAGLARPKLTYRQRNLYCLFDLKDLPDSELQALEAKASRLGDYVLAGHLIRHVDSVWS